MSGLEVLDDGTPYPDGVIFHEDTDDQVGDDTPETCDE